MPENQDNGNEERVTVPQWRPGAIKALYEEALRATREIDPNATRPLNAIFSGMVAALYRPAPQPVQMIPGKVLPVGGLMGRAH
jgi:hypothetical protein